ncbi:MAG: TonB-dependent receptor [Gammaproteobacteria bacterium]|nr:TonB-dependent receptor [Gammaproteobacteria bacterium]
MNDRRAIRHFRQRPAARLFAAGLLMFVADAQAQTQAQAQSDAPPPPAAADSPKGPAKIELGPVDVKGERPPVSAGPLPGLNLTRDQIPSAIQSATAEEIRASHSIGIADFFNNRLQSVTVNDYQGNPFQVDVTFRGFTAGPQLGTPQGLSVFFDGVRVNEPFGDIVNWDLLPTNAIERLDLFPGSNPVFGLNTLGGAISLRSKSGFTAKGVEADALAGSFGRRQLQVAAGGSQGPLAGFGAVHYFDEDGWRDNSPSRLVQGFGRADYRLDVGTVTASALVSGNRLIGNGLVPIEMFRNDRSAVFTSPDQTRNRASQINLSGLFDLTDQSSLTTQLYRRDSRRKSLNGDAYDDFDEFFFSGNQANRVITNPDDPVCRYADVDGDGLRDTVTGGGLQPPLNDPFLEGLCRNVSRLGTARNGAYGLGSNGVFGDAAGVVEGTPNGVYTRTRIGQLTYGGALQWNLNLADHKLLVGASYDDSRARYRATQQLALIDDNRRVYLDPDNIDPLYYAAANPLTINAFNGTSRTWSAYFSETWSARDNLFVTLSARYNINKVDNQVTARIGEDIHEVLNREPTFILCPGNDLASCPDTLGPIIPNNLAREAQDVTREKFGFYSFNPSFGLNWLPIPTVNLYVNLSRGARAPSVIELGCAYDPTPVQTAPGFIDPVTGVYVPPQTAPRSQVGPTCALPTALSGDPYLPQIRSLSAEVGARGQLFGAWEWNASVFRTDLKDDIYFAGASPTRSFFDTIDKTRREGFELGIKGSAGAFDLRASYSLTSATFESEFYVLSPNNSSADFNQNSVPGNVLSPTADANDGRGTFRAIRVDPGALLPGVPLHNLTAGIDWRLTRSFKLGLSAIAHSRSFVRGNENNAHQPEGSDQITDGFGPVPRVGSIFTGGRPFTEKGYVPGYAVINFDASYRLPRGFTVFARITNLLDQTYFSAGRLGVTPYTPSVNGAIGPGGYNYNSNEHQNTTFVGPGAPRGFFGGVSYQFGQ